MKIKISITQKTYSVNKHLLLEVDNYMVKHMLWHLEIFIHSVQHLELKTQTQKHMPMNFG